MGKVIFGGLMIVTIALFVRLMVAEDTKREKYEYAYDKTSPSIQMYYNIKKYAELYDIPEDYAFGLAYQETRYMGPLHEKYDHKQVSFAGAVGPMQVMPTTAAFINHKATVSKKKLTEDIEYNVETSMKLLRYLYDKYGDWPTVFGAYNTGRPLVNQYAMNIINKKYTWIDDQQD